MTHHVDQKRPSKKLPKTVDEAVKRLIFELPLKDKTTIANMAKKDLVTLQTTLGAYIGNQFGIWSGNQELMKSCEFISGDELLPTDFAPNVIIELLWNRLQETHRMRLVR